MKILQVNTYGSGGAGKACLRLREALSSIHGLESEALIAANFPADTTKIHPVTSSKLELLVRRRYTKWLHYRALRKHPKLFEPFALPVSGFRLHNHSAVHSADVINLHWVNNLLDYPTFFANVNKPVVWTLHDMEPWSGGYHYLSGLPKGTFDEVIQKNLACKAKALSSFNNLTIVCLNEWMLKLSKQSKTFGRFRHELIPNSLDTSTFRPHNQQQVRQELGMDLDKPTLLFVSEFVDNQRKGFRYLNEALHQLAESPIHQHLNLAVVGRGNGSDLPKSMKIHSFGHVSDETTMAKIYAAADLFIIPSEEDNMPNTVVESLSCGTPVVAFAAGGIPELINQKELGELCSVMDSTALANTIDACLTRSFNQQTISRIAHQRFAPSIQAASYHQLYLDLV